MNKPPKSIGEQCVSESTDEMDVRDRFTKVLDKIDPNWRNSRITPIQPVVLHGDKVAIAEILAQKDEEYKKNWAEQTVGSTIPNGTTGIVEQITEFYNGR